MGHWYRFWINKSKHEFECLFMRKGHFDDFGSHVERYGFQFGWNEELDTDGIRLFWGLAERRFFVKRNAKLQHDK